MTPSDRSAANASTASMASGAAVVVLLAGFMTYLVMELHGHHGSEGPADFVASMVVLMLVALLGVEAIAVLLALLQRQHPRAAMTMLALSGWLHTSLAATSAFEPAAVGAGAWIGWNAGTAALATMSLVLRVQAIPGSRRDNLVGAALTCGYAAATVVTVEAFLTVSESITVNPTQQRPAA